MHQVFQVGIPFAKELTISYLSHSLSFLLSINLEHSFPQPRPSSSLDIVGAKRAIADRLTSGMIVEDQNVSASEARPGAFPAPGISGK